MELQMLKDENSKLKKLLDMFKKKSDISETDAVEKYEIETGELDELIETVKAL